MILSFGVYQNDFLQYNSLQELDLEMDELW